MKVGMKPMLALKWGERKMDFPLLLSPKLDGIRCIAYFEPSGVRLLSRAGKPIVSMEHVEQQLRQMSFPVGTVLDGELYIHGIEFQKLSGIIRKRNTTDASRKKAEEVQYHVYDLAHSDLKIHTYGYKYRRRYVRDTIKLHPEATGVKFWDSQLVTDAEEFEAAIVQHRDQGFEGSMARPFSETDYYQSKDYGHSERSAFLLKVKLFEDGEFTIKGIEEEIDINGVPKGRTGKFVFTDGTIEFRASGLTDRLKEDSWANPEKYIGRVCTVKYFGKSLGGIPRHPTFLRFRDPQEIS